MNRKANSTIVGIVIVIVVLGVLGYLASQTVFRTAPTTKIIPTPALNIGDIDRSGAADEGDKEMIRNQIGCSKTQPCWNKTIGKTKDGDNPLYVFDLDLNKDGVIAQSDIDLVK